MSWNYFWIQFAMVMAIWDAEATNDKPIAHKYVNSYSLIWNDRGSGADEDVAIWRPVGHQSGYYPLGDVAVATHDCPNTVSLTIKELESGALAPPMNFTEIWRDKGSGAKCDVKILRMNPSNGYTCLGHVAIDSYSSLPNRHVYRCVNSSYVTWGKYEPIWNDKGSGAKKDVGLFSNIEIGNPKAVFANTFTSVASHKTLGGSPLMLNGDYSIVYSLIARQTSKTIAIKVFEGTDSSLIWKDKGSGGRRDISIYRPKVIGGSSSLGDIAVGQYRKPTVSQTVKAMKSDALSIPVDFRKRWTDDGSGADWDVAFWEPVCPSDYVPLGHVAVRNHRSKPPNSAVSCVKHEYVVDGNWQFVWNDAGTGSDVDVTVYQAVARDSNGQGMQVMGTVPKHGSMDRTAYVLNSSVVQYILDKPAAKYTLRNVKYLFEDRNLLSNTSVLLGHSTLKNTKSTESKGTVAFPYTYHKTHDWSIAEAFEIGVEYSVTGGIPNITSATSIVSMETTTTATTGKASKIDFPTFSILATINVPAMSQVNVTAVGNGIIVDVPYTATLITEYADGTQSTQDNYKGIYRGTQLDKVHTVTDEAVPLMDE